ncbi:DUF6541 family protein [Corynebacterium sp. H113]|uniref:DUF6541 family protein n=1 Tax=Corynebacterium sp. H113 TaxID=3133419 RepID=UPI00309ED720
MVLVATVAIVALLLPGLIVGLASGVRADSSIAAAPVVSIGIFGYAAWLCGELELPFNWWTAIAATIFAVAVAFLLARYVPITNRLRSEKEPQSRAQRISDRPFHILLATIVTATTAIGIGRGLSGIAGLSDGPGTLREAWDMHWHYNFLRFISDTGIASPTRAGELMHQETKNPDFYPSAWHAVASLLPGDVFTQANVFAVVAPAVVLPAGVAYLTTVVAGRAWAIIAAPAATIASLAIPQLWVSLLATSSMPYLLSVTAIAATTALLIRGHSVLAVLAIIGVMLTHPASGITVALFAALWWLCRPRFGSALRLALTGLATAGLILPILVSAFGLGEEVAGFTGQADISRGKSMWWALTGTNTHTTEIPTNWILLVLVILGLLVFAFRRRPWTPWPTIAFLVMWFIADNAQVRYSDPLGEWIRFVGSFYYDMAYRLQAPMDILRLLALGVAVAALVRGAGLVVEKLRGVDETPAPATSEKRKLVGVLAIGTVATLALVPTTWGSEAFYREAVQRSDGDELLPPSDVEALDWLAQQPHAFEGLILHNLHDGSGLMYATHGLPSLFRHFSWPEDKAVYSKKALHNVDLAGGGVPGNPDADNPVDVALQKLNVRYVFVAPPDVRGNSNLLALHSWATWSHGLTPVYQNTSATVYAVTSRFTDTQLEAIKESSPHPPGAPNPVWVPPRQPIVAPPTELKDPLRDATVALVVRKTGTADVDKQLARLQKDASALITKRGARVVNAQSAQSAQLQGAALTVTIGRDVHGKPSSGFAVSGHYPTGHGILANTDVPFHTIDSVRPTWQLAASLRDALTFHNLGPASTFEEDGAPSDLISGLYPREVSAAGNARPVVADVSTGSTDDLSDQWTRTSYAKGIADGIASALRQNPELLAMPAVRSPASTAPAAAPRTTAPRNSAPATTGTRR